MVRAVKAVVAKEASSQTEVSIADRLTAIWSATVLDTIVDGQHVEEHESEQEDEISEEECSHQSGADELGTQNTKEERIIETSSDIEGLDSLEAGPPHETPQTIRAMMMLAMTPQCSLNI